MELNRSQRTINNNIILRSLGAAAVLVGLYLTSLYHYLLFHTLVELFSIAIASTVFILAWNARRFLSNGYFLFIGTSMLFVAGIDLLHTLAFQGMQIFLERDTDLPTQLWVGARYLQSLSFIGALFFLRRRVQPGWLVAGFAAVSTVLVSLIFLDIFPSAYQEGTGLTPFKVISEYIVIAIFGLSILLLRSNRDAFEPRVLNFLVYALIASMAAELAFTLYVDVYGLLNLTGHYLKVAAFYFVYKAIIETGFIQPYNLLLRDYRQREEALVENFAQQRILEQRAKQAAEEAERRAVELDAVIKSMVESVVVYNDDGMPVRCNPALIEMYGFDPTTTTRPDILERLNIRSLDDVPYTPESLPSGWALKGSQARNERMKFNNYQNGREYLVLASASPIYIHDQLRGAVAVWHDITEQEAAERRQAELLEENRRQREMLERLVNDAPVGIAFMQGAEHRYLLTNTAFRRMLRLEADPAGKKIMDVFPEFGEQVTHTLNEVYRTGKMASGIDELFPIRTGDQIEEHYFTYTFTPLFDQDAQVEGILVIVTQTTEQVRSRQLLDAERARLKAIIENAPVGIVVTDRDLNVILSNPAAARITPHVVPDQSVYGPRDYDLLTPHGELIAFEDRPIAQSIYHGKVNTNVEVMMQKAGEPSRSLLVNTAPIFDEKGQVIGAVSIFQDITDRKRVEAELEKYAAQLERSNSELQQFAFVVSHDLQEPLRKIRAFGERLKEQAGANLRETEVDFLNRMVNASQRMQKMIDDLLAYSRVTTKALPFEQVDLNRVAEEVITDLEIRIERTGGKVTIGQLPEIEADPMQIRQLLQNLLGNALKYHRPGTAPVVEITAHQDDSNGQVQILVKDNGIGFDLVYLDRIFQPFERLHGRSEYEGTGMGLAICRKIIDRHNGQVTAESKPGEGSTFIITLPLHQSDGVQEPFGFENPGWRTDAG